MKEENAAKIIKGADDLYKVFGFQTFERGTNYICDTLDDLIHQLEVTTSREMVKEALMKAPEPSRVELIAIVTTLKNMPFVLRRLLPVVTKEYQSQLPYPKGGRPKALSPEQCQKMCRAIGRLFAVGVELADAQQRMTLRFGVSLRTIQRAWQNRAKPTTVEDE